MGNRKAFTLMELMVVVVIAAILYVSSLPDSEAATKEGVQQFSDKLEADLSYAQSLSIADPSDPVILKVDPDTNKYWLAKESAPDTPILNPSDKKPYIVQCGDVASVKGALRRIEIVATAFDGDQILKFDSVGTLDQQSKATIRVKLGDAMFDVDVSPQSTRATAQAEIDAAMKVESGGKLVLEGAVEAATAEEPLIAESNTNLNDNKSGGLIGEVVGGLGL